MIPSAGGTCRAALEKALPSPLDAGNGCTSDAADPTGRATPAGIGGGFSEDCSQPVPEATLRAGIGASSVFGGGDAQDAANGSGSAALRKATSSPRDAGNVRERFLEIARQAAEAGYPDAQSLFSLTPTEIEWALNAFAAQERRSSRRMDAQAWLTGRYAAIGWHAPRRYPRRPNAVYTPPAQMSDREMKDVFERLARRMNADHAAQKGDTR